MEFQNKDNEYFSSSEIKNDSQEFFSYRTDTNEKKHNDLKKVNCHLRMAAMILSGGIVIFAGYSTDKNSEPVTIIAESENPQTKAVESQREIEVINEINESINHDDITLSDEEIIYIQNIIEALESENYEDVLNQINGSFIFKTISEKISWSEDDKKIILLDQMNIVPQGNGMGIYFSYIAEKEYLYYGYLQNGLADGEGIKFNSKSTDSNLLYAYHKGLFKNGKAIGIGKSFSFTVTNGENEGPEILEGEFLDDLANGYMKMELSFLNGEFYAYFVNGKVQLGEMVELSEEGDMYWISPSSGDAKVGIDIDSVKGVYVK